MNALIGGQSRHAVSTQSSCGTSRLFLALLVSVLLLTLSAAGALGAAVDGKAQADRLCEEGDELAEQGDDEGAQARWEEALDIYRELGLAGEQASVLHRLGTRLHELQRYQEAQACFEAAIAIEPDCWQALDGWGKALLLWSKMTTGDGAEHLLRLSLEKSAAAHHIEPRQGAYNAACAAALLGEEDECRKWLDRMYEVGRPPSQDSLLNDPDLESVRHKDWFMAYGLLPVQGHSTQYFGGELRWHTGGTPAKAISPVSSEVVFSREETWPPTQSHILKSSIDGSDEVSLTEIAGIGGVNCGPAWSPDGSQIAFQHCDPVEGLLPCKAGFHTWVMNSDGSDAHRLLPEGSGTSSWPTWTPDGSRLVVAHGDPWDSLAQVGIVVDLAGTEVQQVLPGERGPCCPEGSPVAFVDQQRGEVDGEAGWWNRLIIEDADGSNRRTAVEQFIADADIRARYPTQEQLESAPDLPWLLDVRNWVGPNHVIYSPDDSKIAFLAALPFDPDGPLYKEQVDVWVYDLATEDLTRVTNDDVWQHSLVWLSEELGDPREAMNYHQQLGFTLQGQGDPRAALNNFEAAATIAREQAWPEEEAGRLMEMAGAVADLGDLDRALGLYREAIAIYHRLGLKREEVRTRYTMGSRLAEFGKYQEAQAILQEALALCREPGIEKSGDMGEVLFHLGGVARDSANYEEAMAYLQQALALYQELADPRNMMNTHQHLGFTLHEQGDPRAALKHYEAAATIAREHNWPTEQAQHLEEMAGAAADMGDLDGALGLCREAIAIYHRLGLRREEVRPLWEIGRRLGEVGRYEEARAVLEEARALCRELGIEKSADMGEVLFHLGGVARDSAKYEEAMDYLNQALALYQELADPRNMMNTHQHLGFTLQGQGDPRGALKHYEAAATIAREQSWPNEEAGRLMEMAGAAIDMGDQAKATDVYGQMIAIYQPFAAERDWRTAQLLDGLGQVAKSLSRYEEATGYLGEALAIYEEIGRPFDTMNMRLHLGYTLRAQGDERGALEQFEIALTLSRQHNRAREEAQYLVEMAGPATRIGEYTRAVELLREALTIYHNLGRLKEEVRTTCTLAGVLRRAGNQSEGQACLEQARSLCRELPAERDLADALGVLAGIELGFSQEDQARQHREQAIAIYRKLGLKEDEARTLRSTGSHLSEAGRFLEAQEFLEQSLGIYREVSNSQAQAGVLNELGVVAFRLGRYEQSCSYMDQSIAIYEELGQRETPGCALRLLNRGCAMIYLGDYEEAIDSVEEALAIYQEAGVRQPLADIHLGLAAYRLGDYDKAQEHLEKALASARELGDREAEGRALGILSMRAVGVAKYPEGLDYAEEAVSVFRQHGPRFREADQLSALGSAAAQLGEYDQASRCFEQARGIYRTLRFDHAVFSLQVEEAQLRMDQLRLPEAREILDRAGEPLRWGAEQVVAWHLAWGRYHFLTREADEALRRFEQAGAAAGADSSQLTASHIGLGLAHEALGNLEQAVAAYGRAVELSEHSRSRTSTVERVRFFEARAVCFRRLEAYEGLVRVLHRMHRDEDAFFWSEHTKARVLVEAMARAPHGAGLGLPAELRQQEEDLTNRIAALSSRGEERESSQQQLRRLYAERDALVDRLRREYPEYASMQYPLPLHASELALAPNEVLLAYEVTEPQSYLFLVRGGEVERVYEIKLSRPELTDLVERFRSSFVQVTSAADLKALDLAVGEELYDLLLRPALAGVEAGEHVLVVPDEAIGLVPLEALVVRSDGRSQWRATRWGPAPTGVEYVGDTRVFAYWQSGTTMTTVRRLRKAVPGDRVLLVADSALAAPGDCAQPVFQAGGAEQPTALGSGMAGTLRDGQPDGPVSRSTGFVQFTDSLRHAYGERVWVMPGLTATWRVLQREPLDQYAVLVFAMHGVLSDGTSGRGQPALVLSGADGGPSENGHLTMTDVMGLNLRAEIVTLMACETGAGELAGGEGIMAMGRAFQYAGARSVLVSLWKVEDESTNLLAQAFFEKMAAGRPKLEALQAARRVLRESGYEHPFFWAPFVLIGEDEVAGTPGRRAGRLASTSPN